MATRHAEPGEIIDLAHWADDLPAPHSKVILRSDVLEIARLVIKAGQAMHPHRPCRVAGAIVLHCIAGAIELCTGEDQSIVRAGQLVYLDGGTEHAITGEDDSIVLLTILFAAPSTGR